MKKIFVVIPSLNEEANISFVTKIIDQGLTQFFPKFSRYLINSDSNSQDNTVNKFKSTNTDSLKITLKCSKAKTGKGYSIETGFKYAYKQNGKYFLMIDADLKSISPVWINKFLSPIVFENVDYVTPIYSRNRYEGNTTNHFSSPIVYTCFGYDMVQPIAGDFGLSRRLVKAVLNNFTTDYDFLYGIDSLISITALIKGYKIKQQELDKKIHNPSFGKIIPTFTGEAFSTLNLINRNRHKILMIIKSNKTESLYKNKIADEKYVSKPEVNKINNLYNFSIKEIVCFNYKNIIGINYYQRLRNSNFSISSKHWVDIIVDYLFKILTLDLTHKDIEILTKSLLPLYLLRVLTYFNEIDCYTAEKADIIIKHQKTNIRKKLVKKLGF
ncbi:MAG: hypothetical protein KatS3mg092_0070 [Patescibacteria group bacterium]|nr:MAG: hypothetical protein KatS3mg092_0070 [Patescibacteria group bacterium]